MFGQLFVKECRQTAKSLIYWLTVLILVFSYTSQLGELEIDGEPQKGQQEYGYKLSQDPAFLMKSTLGQLTEEYVRKRYTTYPVGFYKSVTLNEEEDQRIGEILQETAGIDGRKEAERVMEEWYAATQPADETNPAASAITGRLKVEPADGLTADRFHELMEEVDGILGGGSDYNEANRKNNARVPMTYEDAVREYDTLIKKDRLSGGYARLFCDYMGIFLGVLPVFLATTRGLRDRRSRMQELIYTRKCSSLTVTAGRYLAMLVMLTIPVLALSFIPLSKCISYAGMAGIAVDLWAFVKYTFGWLCPTIMIVTAAGMFLTELTETAVAVLAQGVWWFAAIFGGVQRLKGGMYGWNLVPRHNTQMNWQGFQDGFAQLAANRIFYAVLSLLLVMGTAFIFEQKRKGRLHIRGKILAHRKNKS